MSVVAEIGEYLQDNGVGVLARDLFIGRMPDQPTPVVAIAEYSGGPSTYIQEQAYAAVERPHIQVKVRHSDYEQGDTMIQSIYRLIDSIRNQTIAGSYYLGAFPTQRPFLLERDVNEDMIFVFNAELSRRTDDEPS